MISYVLYSGGLDSILAIKLIQEQGIKVIGVHFISPFFGNPEFCRKIAKEQKFKLMIKKLGKNYLNVLREPKYGYGSGINPCLDCHLYMLEEVKKMAKKNMIATGEVLGQRPMSQKYSDLKILEKELKLENKILRPLSAKILPETIYEKRKMIDRKKLLGIRGRGRKKQLKLAKKYHLKYLTPAGGCLLTNKEFSKKLKDLFAHKKRISENDLELLKVGRHFRIGENKIIVGRNKKENEKLKKLKDKNDFIFKVEGIGPITLLQGKKNKKVTKFAAELTLFYSDEEKVLVRYGKKFEKKIKVDKIEKERFEKFKV